ncbi:MAG: AMP-binding protein [Lachnospiraceae bacterium]|nr:AMP-binding protein [Lachnospiraceae bacterium]
MNSVLYSDRGSWTSIGSYIFDCCEKNSSSDCCVWLENGEKRSISYGQMLDAAKRVGSYLSAAVGKGGHVALLGKKSVEWIASYCGCLCYGVVVCPLDAALPTEESAKQFCFSDSTVLLYDSACAGTAEQIKECRPETLCLPLRAGDGSFSVSSLIRGEYPASQAPELKEDDLAEILFTSGTTGFGKGVMLSVGNICAAVMFGIRLVDCSSGETLLSILPNNHSFELVVGLLTPLYFGMSIILCGSVKAVKDNFRAFGPSIMLMVPMLMQHFRKEILREAKRRGEAGKLEETLLRARQFGHAGAEVRRESAKDILSYFGGNLKCIICGGAFLSEELVSFYDDLGIRFIEGYGITECAPIVSCNTDRFSCHLGVISPYCEVRIEEGEICVSGKNVMLGYYKNPEQTARAIKDGWFHTGDLGALDERGCLILHGRKDNLIVNSNGENVSPEMIENLLSTKEIIAESVVYAEDDLLAASVFPNFRFAEANGISDVEKAVREAVEETNKSLPHKLRVERVHIRKEPFEMTSTMKVKRGKQ